MPARTNARRATEDEADLAVATAYSQDYSDFDLKPVQQVGGRQAKPSARSNPRMTENPEAAGTRKIPARKKPAARNDD